MPVCGICVAFPGQLCCWFHSFLAPRNPTLLLLDEPTSGLDSKMSDSLMRDVKQIGEQGCTVIATIHQPSETCSIGFDWSSVAGSLFPSCTYAARRERDRTTPKQELDIVTYSDIDPRSQGTSHVSTLIELAAQ